MSDQCLVVWLTVMGLVLIGLVVSHLVMTWRHAELQKDVLHWVKYVHRVRDTRELDGFCSECGMRLHPMDNGECAWCLSIWVDPPHSNKDESNHDPDTD